MVDSKLILDIIVAILLVATIAYAIMLNRRLSELRRNRDDLARLVNAFNDATQRAEAGIPKLRRAAEEAGSALQERVEKAQSLRDDLAFMIERADAMANRLEGSVRQARDVKIPAAPAPAAVHGAAAAMPAGPALGAQPRRPAPAPAAPSPAASAAPALGGLASGFGDMAGEDSFEDDRSEAERELLRALQSVR
ncbi:hypothetical protein GALL_243130 [mine drainage metagenome]|uniref:DUF6468 domain-containing protein n=1 Tax=mine drainage metagenome TaxID=410659 RepID=A0A1J5RED4_9ZZZZ